MAGSKKKRPGSAQQKSLLSAFGLVPKAAKKSKPSSAAPSTAWAPKIFCDLDGVLVDFDQGVQDLTGKRPEQLFQGTMWAAIAKEPNFYRNLGWMADGEELWEAIRPLKPCILTGLPRTHSQQARRDKFAWCQQELCVEVAHWDKAGDKSTHARISKADAKKTAATWCKVITCWSKNKHMESGAGHVLIDDRESLRDAWEEAGGIFVHHVNTEQTLRILRERHILVKPASSAAAKKQPPETKAPPLLPATNATPKEDDKGNANVVGPSNNSDEKEEEDPPGTDDTTDTALSKVETKESSAVVRSNHNNRNEETDG